MDEVEKEFKSSMGAMLPQPQLQQIQIYSF